MSRSPRKKRKTKPFIVVFCEGESEQAYTRYLKEIFKDIALIKYPSQTGLFEYAQEKFNKDPKYRDNAEVTDEIWFFYDIEEKDAKKWSKRLRIINYLRGLRNDPNIRVRLLMTTGCVEYWLLLHYYYSRPSIKTVAEKHKIEESLKKKEPLYEKGDYEITSRIAANYSTALENGEKTLSELQSVGLPCLEDSDERNTWLNTHCETFTTVQEAISFLENQK